MNRKIDARGVAMTRKPDGVSVARCRVVLLDSDSELAECAVLIDDHELPRVSFPAQILRAKGLRVGSWFHWVMRGDRRRIRQADIDTNVPQTDESTSAEKARLDDDLGKAFLKRLEEEWPEFTGDGR